MVGGFAGAAESTPDFGFSLVDLNGMRGLLVIVIRFFNEMVGIRALMKWIVRVFKGIIGLTNMKSIYVKASKQKKQIIISIWFQFPFVEVFFLDFIFNACFKFQCCKSKKAKIQNPKKQKNYKYNKKSTYKIQRLRFPKRIPFLHQLPSRYRFIRVP